VPALSTASGLSGGACALVGGQVVEEDALRDAGLHARRARGLVHLDGEAKRHALVVGRAQDPALPERL